MLNVNDCVRLWRDRAADWTHVTTPQFNEAVSVIFDDLGFGLGLGLSDTEKRAAMCELERLGHDDRGGRAPRFAVLFAVTKYGKVPADIWRKAGGVESNRKRGNYMLVPDGSRELVHWWKTVDFESNNCLTRPEQQERETMTTKSSYRDMPYAEWVALPDWPAQRDTARHAAKLLRSPLFDPNHPTLGQHCAAVTVGGVTYKVNGITTTSLAEAGRCKFPTKVRVLHFYCDTQAEAHSVYLSFDASWQTKGAQDRLHSAFRVNGFDPKSPTFQADKGTSALIWAYNALRGHKSNAPAAGATLEIIVAELRASVIEVDELLLACKGKPPRSTPAIAAMLLTHRQALDQPGRERREKMLARWRVFWRAFIESKGSVGDAASPHNKLWNFIDTMLHSARKATGELIEIALYCYERRDERNGIKRKGHVDLTTFHTVPRMVASVEQELFKAAA